MASRRDPVLADFDPMALKIGHVIMAWSSIEDALDQFIQELAHIDDPQFADVIAGNIELRSKIAVIKGLASLRSKMHPHLSSDWLAAVLSILDYIDNDLRPERNLIAHAHWFKPPGKGPLAVTKKTKIVRPQAFERVLETRQEKKVRLSQLRALTNKMMYAWHDLFILIIYSTRPYPLEKFDDGTPMPKLTLRRYLRAVGHTLRVVRIAPEKKRTTARRPKKPPPPPRAKGS